jgi:hypothetical protein
MTQFFFTLTNVEAEALLKEEIRLRYPELRMSYSRPGFITFKGEKDIVFRPYFCRVSGLSQGKFKKSELKLEKAWVYALNETLTLPKDLKVLTEQSHFRPGETVTLVVMAGEDEFWVGTYTQLSAGTNNQYLVVDTSKATGLKYITLPDPISPLLLMGA